ncbi:MAG: hypothetical protein ACI8RZ_000849 [Myxococcota bacterium]|jgi:hypothetical protein
MFDAMRGVHTQVRDLSPGHRAWFWLCPQASPGLLLAPLSDDPGMRTLKRAVSRVSVPEGAAPIIGLLTLDEDGRIDLGAPGLTADHLAGLAGWVKTHVADYPGLGLFCNTRGRVLDERFQVKGSLEDEDLWQGVPPFTAPGTLAAATQTLERLAVGQQAWFWATLAGPGGRPFLVVVSTAGDIDELNYEVRQVVKRTGKAVKNLQGVITRLADGSLHMACSAAASKLKAIITGIQKAHGKRLPTLLRLTPERRTADLSAQSAVLSGMAGEADALFWFSTEAPTTLLLSTDKDSLREAAKATGKYGIRGQVHRSRKGWLEFRIRQDHPELLPALARWTATHAADWPALKTIKGARVVARDAEGNPLARYRDDAAWAAL